MALVVLLRGVNVGGHRAFRPSALARDLAHLDIVNVGAAGTFVVRRPVARAALRAAIAERLPFETEIMICEGRDVLDLLSADPFSAEPQHPDVVRFVAVLARAPSSAPRLPFDLPGEGPWAVRVLGRRGRFAPGLYRRTMKAVGSLGALDRAFGVPVTVRNWNTWNGIADLLRSGRGGPR